MNPGQHIDPGTPFFTACDSAGYAKDDGAPAGKKIFTNCGGPMLRDKKVEGVKVDAKVVAGCSKFKTTKDKFEKQWQITNKG